jgi:sulfotransferase family protein
MAAPRADRKRLLIVGLPRSGTTLMATLLAAQPNVHFLTDYFSAFSEALFRTSKRWDAKLSLAERRIALALVRDQFLRVRHPVLVKPDAFECLDDLHRAVLEELVTDDEELVGHKLLLGPDELAEALAHGRSHCLLMYRDPRDAALSFFHRTGSGVEGYVRVWREMLRRWGDRHAHPRLFTLRFEDFIREPATALAELGAWLGLSLTLDVPELAFRRSRAHGALPWQENSAFADVRQRFDPRPLGRWHSELDSPVVRYAAWATARDVVRLGYEPAPALGLSAHERLRFSALRALERAENRGYDVLSRSIEGVRRALWQPGERRPGQ